MTLATASEHTKLGSAPRTWTEIGLALSRRDDDAVLLEVGVGTGRGLSIAYALIHDRHGGSICHTSQIGFGASFTARVPIGSAASTGHEDTVASATDR